MFSGLTSFLRGQQQFLVVVAVWIISGMIATPLAFVTVGISLFLMQQRGFRLELLLGFLLILTLSDSRQASMKFAGDVKEMYVALMGIFIFFNRQQFQPFQKLYLRFLPFFICAAICMVFSTVFITSLQKTLSYILLVIVVPNYLAAAWRDHGPRALSAIIWWGTLMLIAGLVMKFISPLSVLLEGRFSGILGNPNGLGLFCLIFFILFTVVRDIYGELFTKWETRVIWVAIVLSVLLSGSRNSLLTILIFLMFRQFYKLSPFLGFIILVVLIILYQFILSNFPAIIIALNLQEYFRLDSLDTGSGRLIAWNFGWEWITKSPIIGNGIGFTDDLYRRYYAVLSLMGHQGNAHNSYITFWLDTGIFGLLSYIIGVLTGFLNGAKRVRSSIPAFYAILFSAFFESWLTASLNPFTIQFIIVLTLITSPVFAEQQEQVQGGKEEEEAGENGIQPSAANN